MSFLQNHDQVGNRARGERITMLAPPRVVRCLTSILLLAPQPPLLFMGEEFAAGTPFQFFCDFEPALARAVAKDGGQNSPALRSTPMRRPAKTFPTPAMRRPSHARISTGRS